MTIWLARRRLHAAIHRRDQTNWAWRRRRPKPTSAIPRHALPFLGLDDNKLTFLPSRPLQTAQQFGGHGLTD